MISMGANIGKCTFIFNQSNVYFTSSVVSISSGSNNGGSVNSVMKSLKNIKTSYIMHSEKLCITDLNLFHTESIIKYNKNIM